MSRLTAFWRAKSRKGRKSTALVALEREDTIDAQIQRVGATLDQLQRFQPASGFVDRVMARITLPAFVPVHVRLGAMLKRHWILTTASVTGAAAAGMAAVAWNARYPEATPIAIAVFVVRRVGEFAWGSMLSVARLFYESGFLLSLQGIADSLTTVDALMALATVSLVGIGSFSVLLRLMEKPHDMLETSVAR